MEGKVINGLSVPGDLEASLRSHRIQHEDGSFLRSTAADNSPTDSTERNHIPPEGGRNLCRRGL